MKDTKTRLLAVSAMLVTVMLVLGYLESLIPMGIPGIKLGLSNSVLLLSLYWFGIPETLILMVVKVVLSGLLFSGVSAMMYAFAGGIFSVAMMSLLWKLDYSTIVIAMVGAVCHNIGQVAIAMLILETEKLVYYMGILIFVGLGTGFVTGTVTKLLLKRIPSHLGDHREEKQTETQK